MTEEEFIKKIDNICDEIKQLKHDKMDIIDQYLKEHNLYDNVIYHYVNGIEEAGRIITDYDTSRSEYIHVFAPYTKSGKLSEKNHIKIFNVMDFTTGRITPDMGRKGLER